MKPLTGWRVAVTRPEAQAKGLENLLEAAGAAVLRYPLLDIYLYADNPAFQAAIQSAADLFVFTSANGVSAYTEAAKLLGLPTPRGAVAYCVGAATAKKAAAAGFQVPALPAVAAAENLPALMGRAQAETSALCIRGNLADEALPRELRDFGYIVIDAVGYETRQTGNAAALFQAAAGGQVDVVTLFSGSAIHALLQGQAERLPETCLFAVVGPKTAAELVSYGYHPQMVAGSASAGALVRAIITYAMTRNP